MSARNLILLFLLTGCGQQLPQPDAKHPLVSVTVGWNSIPGIGYHLHWGTKSHRYTQVLTLTKEPFLTPSIFVAGSNYYFALSAYNSAGESAPGPEYAFTPSVLATRLNPIIPRVVKPREPTPIPTESTH